MKKRVICAAAAALVLSTLAACGGSKPTAETTSQATSAISVSLTTAHSTTGAASTTAITSSAVVQTVTEYLSTATKKETTTSAPATTAILTTTLPQYDENKPDGYYDKIQNVFREELKYGVSRRRNEINYIETLADGTRVTVKQHLSEYYNRLGYRADYEDLLPAAKENINTYSDLINLELSIINGYRAKEGIAPLSLSTELTEIASARAEEIAWSGKHSHTRPNGKNCSTILKEAGITKGTAGENIGWGYSSVEDVCQAWKDSETHYENIMNPEFVKIGIGIAADPDPDKLLCWAQIFMDE
ncbi:MAG: CAP domain-containing protein [Clostridia bacterium]|nr:CAP domain-containing protein [Clostridia bacterium]